MWTIVFFMLIGFAIADYQVPWFVTVGPDGWSQQYITPVNSTDLYYDNLSYLRINESYFNDTVGNLGNDTYARLDGDNMPFTGDVSVLGNLTAPIGHFEYLNLSNVTIHEWDDLKYVVVNLTANDTFLSITPQNGQAFVYNSTYDKYVNNYILALHTKIIDIAGYFTDEDVEGALGQLANEVGGGTIPGTNTSSDWQDSVLSKSVTSPPASPSPDDRYIIPYAESGDWYGAIGDWDYRQEIVLESDYVSADQVNMPITIIINNATNAMFGNALSSGNDIVFTHSNKTTKLSHELVLYNDIIGYEYLEAHVNVSGLNSTSDTTIYMYYGNAGASPQEDSAAVWDANYESTFHMNNGNATTLNDSTGNSYIARNSGLPDEIDGIIGKAQYYDGTNDWTNTTVITDLSGGGTFTISAWLKDVSSGSQYMIAQAHTMGGYSSDWIYGYQNNGAWMRSKTIDGGNILSSGGWHKMDFVFDGTIGLLYIDGVKRPTTMTPTGYGGINAIKFFTRGDAIGRYKGTLDEVRISTTNRSAEWLNTSYNNVKYINDFLSFGVQTVSSGAVTEWTGYTNNITTFNALLGNWTFETPDVGWATIVTDEGIPYWWDGTEWSALKSSISHKALSDLLGVDANNDGYHLTAPQYVAAIRDATNALNGLMPSGKLDSWDNKWSIGTPITESVSIEMTEPEILLEDTDDGSAYRIAYDKARNYLNISKGNNSGEEFVGETGTANLHVDGTVVATSSIVTGSSYSGEIIPGQANIIQYILGSGASSIGRFFCYDGSSYYKCIFGDYNGGAGGIVLDVGGNVGITKATPTVSLDVGGSGNFDGNFTAHAMDVDNNVTATTIDVDGLICIDDKCIDAWGDINTTQTYNTSQEIWDNVINFSIVNQSDLDNDTIIRSDNTSWIIENQKVTWQNSSDDISYDEGDVSIANDFAVTGNITTESVKTTGNVANQFQTLQSVWAFKFDPAVTGGTDIGLQFNAVDGIVTKYISNQIHRIDLNGNLYTGNLLDTTITFSPNSPQYSGNFTWMEDEDYFAFPDNITSTASIGMGTTTPNHAIEVSGGINATQINSTTFCVDNTCIGSFADVNISANTIWQNTSSNINYDTGNVTIAKKLTVTQNVTSGTFKSTSDIALEFENLQSMWAFRYNPTLIADTGFYFDAVGGNFLYKYSGTTPFQINILGTLTTLGNAHFGNTLDTTLTFSPAGANTGSFKWMEDENYFEFQDDINIDTTKAIIFDDRTYNITSNSSNLDINSRFRTINLNSNLDIMFNSDINVSGDLNVGGALGLIEDLTVNDLITAKRLIINDTVLWASSSFGYPRVAIGKSNPTYALEVVGDVNVSDILYVGNDTVSNGKFRTTNAVMLEQDASVDFWAFKYSDGIAPNTGVFFDGTNGEYEIQYVGGNVWKAGVLGTSFTYGAGFDSEMIYAPTGTNTGSFKWWEDENYFKFNDDVIFDEEVNFTKQVHINNNITMKSPDGNWWDCGVNDSGMMVCT